MSFNETTNSTKKPIDTLNEKSPTNKKNPTPPDKNPKNPLKEFMDSVLSEMKIIKDELAVIRYQQSITICHHCNGYGTKNGRPEFNNYKIIYIGNSNICGVCCGGGVLCIPTPEVVRHRLGNHNHPENNYVKFKNSSFQDS